jgi:hypothetical protein
MQRIAAPCPGNEQAAAAPSLRLLQPRRLSIQAASLQTADCASSVAQHANNMACQQSDALRRCSGFDSLSKPGSDVPWPQQEVGT